MDLDTIMRLICVHIIYTVRRSTRTKSGYTLYRSALIIVLSWKEQEILNNQTFPGNV